MNRVVLPWLLVGLLLSASLASAQIDDPTAEDLMHACGLWAQLQDIAPQIAAEISAAADRGEIRASTAAVVQLVDQAKRSFDADRLRSTARIEIARGVAPEHLPALLDWYRSPAGTEMARTEEAASADSRDPQIVLAEDKRLLATLPPTRRALLEQLVAASRTVDASIEAGVAIQSGLESATPNRPRTPLKDIQSALEAQRPQLEEEASATYAGVYSGCSDATVEAYVRFLSSPAGAHFTSVGIHALASALREAMDDFGRGIARSRNQHPS